MTYKTKKTIKRAARAGVSGVAGVLRAVLKTLGLLLLIFVTTGAIFAFIFVIYVKTNLASGDLLGTTFEEYKLNETSIIYYQDKSTGEWVESSSIISDQGFRYWVPYEKIPDKMVKALVSIEDKRFYTHHGVDWLRTAKAFVYMFAGMRNTFGGSTITQQLRKNLTGDDEGTVRRKLTEIFAALQVEQKYEKWQIIEWYLNIVNFGHGKSSGIGDAARYYFDKDVENLSLAEICSIIGITNNPSMYNPYYHPEANKTRQETILKEMYKNGYISREEYEEAVNEELHFVYASTGGDSGQIYSWFDETVRQDAAEFLAEQRGITVDAAKSLLATGGFKIYSTMDPEVQAKVDEVYGSFDWINSLGASGSSQQFQSAIVITDPYTGNIVALAGAVGEKNANLLYNMATMAKRPPGSSFKPIAVYAPAMDYGLITPDTLVLDDESVVINGRTGWPKNDDRKYHQIVTIREGLYRSFNVVSAQVLDWLTPAASYAFVTQKLHMDLDPADQDYAPLCLGQLTYGITVREMAAAFNIFPNGGMYIEPRTFTEIRDMDGKLLYENKPESEAVISETTAYWMTDMLHDATTQAYATGKSANVANMPTAGKTGSSGGYKDRWFVGFTPYYCAAVWCGYPMPHDISVSGNPAAKTFKQVMTAVHENLETKQFRVPANTYQTPVQGVETISYTVRCVGEDMYGFSTTLSETTAEGIIGREIDVTAPVIDGYDLQGEETVKFTPSVEPQDNIVEFRYKSNVYTPPTDWPWYDPWADPDPGTDPGGTDPGTDPGTEPDTSTDTDDGGKE